MSLPTPPTMLLAAGGLAMVSGQILRWPLRLAEFWKWYFLISLLIAACGIFIDPLTPPPSLETLNVNRVWVNDPLAVWEECLVLTFGLLSGVALFESPSKINDPSKAYGFLLFVTAGLLLVARSNDFLSLGLSLEIISLAMLAHRRFSDSPNGSSELLTSSAGPISDRPQIGFELLTSVWLWLGIGLLTNCVATTHFDAVRLVLLDAYDPGDTDNSSGAPSKLLLLSTGLILSSIVARMGLVPFQLGFGPDMRRCSFRSYGLTTLVGTLTGSIALTRLSGRVFAGLGQPLVVLMSVVCLSTFVISAVMAVRGFSANVKAVPRWAACLMLLQSAWLGVGLMTATMELQYPETRWGAFSEQNETIGLIVLSQFAGLFACGGMVWTVNHLERSDRGIEFLEDLKGLGRYAPAAGLGLIVPLASLIGIPWTAGFWSRWLILLAASNVHLKATSSIYVPYAGLRIVLMIGTVATIIVAGSVIRLLREMLLESSLTRPAVVGGRGPLVASLMAAFATVLIGVAPQLLLVPLRSIDSPREIQPRIQPRGSGKNHSVFRMGDEHLVKFSEWSCQARSSRQVNDHFLISIKLASCSWQACISWAQFCPVWSGTSLPDHHPREDNPFILVDPYS